MLYQRYLATARAFARQLSRSSIEIDDYVSEAFARVLDLLRAGRGPDSAFRAYLIATVRNVVYDTIRKGTKLDLAADITAVRGVRIEDISVPFRDTTIAELDRTLVATAFARLPERWQTVLWHTIIQEQSAAEVAPVLGLAPNGVSALAYRAREGLRQAYLQAHLDGRTSTHRRTTDNLGAWTRKGLSKRDAIQVRAHLDECGSCRELAAELAAVNGGAVRRPAA